MRYLLSLLVAVLSITAYSFQPQKDFLKLEGCFSVRFLQREVFEGNENLYEGFLKKENNRVRIVYWTDPPFEVIYDGNLIEVGYEGEEKQLLDPEENENPILEILLNLDNLERVFKIEECQADRCLLKPKGELSQYLEQVEVYLDNGGIKRIAAYGGDYGSIYIDILSWTPCEFKKGGGS